MEPSARLKKALDAGSMENLFSVLRGWTTEELQALVRDAEGYFDLSIAEIDEAWKQVVFRPEVFFSSALLRGADKLRAEKRVEILAVLSEICSVAIHYLEERGVKTESVE